MNNYTEQIMKLEKLIQENKLNQAKLEEKVKMLNEDKNKILEELKGLNVTEVDLDKEIQKLDTSIAEQLAKCEEMLK